MTPSAKIQTIDPVGLDEGVTQSTREADYQLPKLNKIKPLAQSCSRTNQTFLFKLGNDHNRSLDPRNCEGIQNPLCLSTQTMEKETHKSKVESRHQFYKRSHFSASTKRSTNLYSKIVQEQPNQFTSTLFVVKQASKERPIFNLKNLNRYVQPCKFKMEGLDTVRKLIQPGDFMMNIDLQDAYFSVPIHDSYKHYLRFIFQGTTYEFQCLLFGLPSAPWTFTKLLKPVISLLRSRGIRIVIYLDDMLILDQSPDRLASVFHSIVNVLKQLGFLIKQEKCSQVPTQRIEFLGSLINSTDMLQAVPSEKHQNIQGECRKVYQDRSMSMTELSALLGRMIHCTQRGLAQAPLHYRALQRQHVGILRHQKISYQSRTKISLSKDSLTDLQWWISPQIIQFNNTPLTLPAFDMVIYTDASTQGWGAQCNGILTGGDVGLPRNPGTTSTFSS